MRHRKTEPHGLSSLMVRVLTQNDDLDLVKRTGIKCFKSQIIRRVYLVFAVLFRHLIREGAHAHAIPLHGNRILPPGVEIKKVTFHLSENRIFTPNSHAMKRFVVLTLVLVAIVLISSCAPAEQCAAFVG